MARTSSQVHVTADLPIRAQALPFADRVEIRFGKAFPVVLSHRSSRRWPARRRSIAARPAGARRGRPAAAGPEG